MSLALSSFFSNSVRTALKETKATCTPIYLENLRKLSNAGNRAAACKDGYYVMRCFDCGHQWIAPADCKSRLCVRCSEKLHQIRVAKCLRKLGSKDRWTHVIFTLPSDVWVLIDSWGKIRKLRQAAAKICRKKIGRGGVIVVHTFSTEDNSKWKPHVHCLVYGRKPLSWQTIRDEWVKVLHRLHGVESDKEINIHEKQFDKKRLPHRLRYVLRLPAIRFDTLRHFAFAQGKAIYVFFGKQVHEGSVVRLPEKLKCPKCGSTAVTWICYFDGKDRFIYPEGWHDGLFEEDVLSQLSEMKKKGGESFFR